MTNEPINTVNVHQLKQEMENNPNLCLIDVRELIEWQQLRIPQAVHIPKDEIALTVIAKFPNKKEIIYLHCKAGVRSLHAAESLLSLGYEQVYSVDGGIIDWAMYGYPLESSTQE